MRDVNPEIGRGLFASEPIARGRVVGIDGGQVLTSTAGLPRGVAFAVVVAEGLILAPNDFAALEPLWLLNHSCEPTLARLGGLVYQAKADIAAGEMLTIDYAPLVSGCAGWQMTCHCGAPSCRGVIREEDWRQPELARRLWPEWLPFVQRRILERAGAE